MSLENARLVETLSIHQENLRDFLLEQIDSVLRLMFSVPDLLHKVVLFHLRREIVIFTTYRQYHLFRVESLSMYFRCVHLFQLLKVHNQYVSFPDSLRVKYIPEEYPWEQFLSKLMDS